MTNNAVRGRSAIGQCDNITECVLSLNRQEIAIYKQLVNNGPMRVEEISETIGRHRSTASRCLKRLESCGICQKRKSVIEKGGYYYTYEATPPETVREILMTCTEIWYERRKSAIDDFFE